MGRPHFVVIRRDNHEDEKHSMKPWLRENPEHNPEGMHPDTHTSQQLRNGLKRNGWEVKDEETDTEVHVKFPFEDEEEDAATPSTFALEHHLRDFIAKKFGELTFNGKKLKPYLDPEGRPCTEYPTDTGRIDILAVSADDDNQEYFVIELKLSRGSYQAIGQLMSYMDWVKENIAGGEKVNGIIVAQSIDDRLKRAARMMCSRVELYEYELILKLIPVPLTLD